MKKIQRSVVEKANTAFSYTMTPAAQQNLHNRQEALVKLFQETALDYILEVEHRDIRAELKNWTSFSVETDHTPFDKVVVKQYAHSERSPATLRDRWDINKSDLVANK